MRFTTKFSGLIILLVSLAMVLMLLGSALSFFSMTHERMETRLNTLTTALDQVLLTDDFKASNSWLPLVMHPLGIISLQIKADGHELYSLSFPQNDSPWRLNRTLSTPMIQHPGYQLDLVYQDPLFNDKLSLYSAETVALAMLIMLVIVLLSLRWLRRQIEGEDYLESRAKKILSGDWESVMKGDRRERPHNASLAFDRILTEYRDMQDERNRVDTLIRSFAAQDAKTGLNNRLFFDNQLALQLEEPGAHGVVMMIRLPDFDTLRENHDDVMVKELMYSSINMLSTFVFRNPAALLARYFYSDFTVLLPHSTVKDAEMMAAQLVKAVDMLPPSPLVDRDAFMFIGIVAYSERQRAGRIINYVEQATRHAALQGGNCWSVYDNVVEEQVRGSVKWRTLLEQTLAQDAIHLYQRPAVTIDRQIHHREIMNRIFDGEQMLLSSEYLPQLEQLGLIQQYDQQQLRNILPLLPTLQDNALAFQISVASLCQHEFQIWLRNTLMQCEKKYLNKIIFELAEADACQHLKALRSTVALITGLGCRLAISQAGLTIVNTSYIKYLPVELIKLHPSLILNIDRREENQLFVESLCSVAKGAKVKVFASGVRTLAEWQTLKAKGVFGGQGDFFAALSPVDKK